MIKSLDTNICIEIIRGTSPLARNRLAQHRAGELVISSIVYFELMTGAEKSGNSQKSRQLVQELSNRIAIEDFSQEDAGMAARIRATLEASGRSIGPMDMLIAGQALCRGYAVATNNVREFSRIPGLICEDWLIA